MFSLELSLDPEKSIKIKNHGKDNVTYTYRFLSNSLESYKFRHWYGWHRFHCMCGKRVWTANAQHLHIKIVNNDHIEYFIEPISPHCFKRLYVHHKIPMFNLLRLPFHCSKNDEIIYMICNNNCNYEDYIKTFAENYIPIFNNGFIRDYMFDTVVDLSEYTDERNAFMSGGLLHVNGDIKRSRMTSAEISAELAKKCNANVPKLIIPKIPYSEFTMPIYCDHCRSVITEFTGGYNSDKKPICWKHPVYSDNKWVFLHNRDIYSHIPKVEANNGKDYYLCNSCHAYSAMNTTHKHEHHKHEHKTYHQHQHHYHNSYR